MAFKVGNTSSGKGLTPEGLQKDAILVSVKPKTKTKLALGLEFIAHEQTHAAELECGARWGRGTELCRVVEALLQRGLTDGEVADFDLESLVGKECMIVTANVRGSGGKLRTIVTSVLPKSAG